MASAVPSGKEKVHMPHARSVLRVVLQFLSSERKKIKHALETYCCRNNIQMQHTAPMPQFSPCSWQCNKPSGAPFDLALMNWPSLKVQKNTQTHSEVAKCVFDAKITYVSVLGT